MLRLPSVIKADIKSIPPSFWCWNFAFSNGHFNGKKNNFKLLDDQNISQRPIIWITFSRLAFTDEVFKGPKWLTFFKKSQTGCQTLCLYEDECSAFVFWPHKRFSQCLLASLRNPIKNFTLNTETASFWLFFLKMYFEMIKAGTSPLLREPTTTISRKICRCFAIYKW